MQISFSPLDFPKREKFLQQYTDSSVKNLGHEVFDPWKLTGPEKDPAVLEMPYRIEKLDEWRRSMRNSQNIRLD